MADNTVLNSGSGGDTISTDDLGSVKVQRVKVQYGTDGSATDVSDSNPLPVDDAGGSLTVDDGGSTLSVDDGGGTLTVDGTVAATQSGTWTVQPGNTANTTAWKVDASSAAVPVTDNSGSLTVDDGGSSLTVDGTVAISGTVAVTDNASTLSVDDGGSSLTVDNAGTFAVQAAQSGTWTVQPGNTANTTAWKVDGSAVTQPVSNAGLTELAAAINASQLDVNIATDSVGIGGGTQYAGDSSGASTDTGTMALALRDDAGGSLVSTDGDRTPLSVDSSGALRVTGGGGGTEYTVNDAAPANPTGSTFVMERDDALSALTEVEGDWTNPRANANGALWVKHDGTVTVDGSGVTQPVSGTVTVQDGGGTVSVDDGGSSLTVDNGGTFAVQAAQSGTWTVQPGNTANTTAWKVDGSAVTQPVSYATTGSGTATGALRVELANNGTGKLSTVSTVTTCSTVSTLTGGGVAHDSADSGNPVKVGAKARTADITAVAANDRTDMASDTLGHVLTRPYSLHENLVNGSTSAITGTTSTSVIAAAGAGVRNYITALTVTNSHATVGTLVSIKDGSGGSTLWQGYCAPAGGGYALSFPSPLRGSAATAVHAVCGTTGSNVYVSASGYRAAV